MKKAILNSEPPAFSILSYGLLLVAAVGLTGCLGSRMIIYQMDGKTPAAEGRIGVLHRGSVDVGPCRMEVGTDPRVADGGTTVLVNLTNRLTPDGAAGVIGKGLEKGVGAPVGE